MNKVYVRLSKPTVMKLKTTCSNLFSVFFCCGLFFLAGCSKNEQATRTYTIFKPVYTSKSTVLSEINSSISQPVESPGKIYIKDNFIFLNDANKGIHVFDNSDPVHPVQKAFLKIPGNLDIAVKGNTLYADMYADLLAID